MTRGAGENTSVEEVEVLVRHGSEASGSPESPCHRVWTAQAIALIRSHWPHHDDRVLQDLHFNTQPHVLVLSSVHGGDAVAKEGSNASGDSDLRQVIGLGFLACSSASSAMVHTWAHRCARDPTASVELTFVVVDVRCRGRGIGRRVVEALEAVAVRYGYCFAHLTTTSEVRFYERLGYRRGRLAQRVYERRCFQTSAFSQQGLNALNQMLLRRRPTHGSPPHLTDPTGVAMHKQLVEEVPRFAPMVLPNSLVPTLSGDTHNSNDGSNDASKRERTVAGSLCSRKLVWSFPVPWQPQIGPSCGLTLLRMIRDRLFPRSDSVSWEWPSLLSLARSRGVTLDGEVLSTSAMATLAVEYLAACQTAARSRKSSDTEWSEDVTYEFRSEVRRCSSVSDVQQALLQADDCRCGTDAKSIGDAAAERRFLLVPFDRGVSDAELVGFHEGLRAHWALVSGLFLDNPHQRPEGSSDSGPSVTDTEERRRDAEGRESCCCRCPSKGCPGDLLSSWVVALQHGASADIGLTSAVSLCESNAQLHHVVLKSFSSDDTNNGTTARDDPVEVSLDDLTGSMVLIVVSAWQLRVLLQHSSRLVRAWT